MSYTKSLSFILLLTFVLNVHAGVEVRSDESYMDRVTRCLCGEDVLLRCMATSKPGVQYRTVIWYKVSEAPSHQLTGLVMKRLTHHNSSVQKYKGVERDLKLLGDSQSLILPNVTLEDAGRYRCFLSAPLGHQNQEGEVHLRVYDMSKEWITKSQKQALTRSIKENSSNEGHYH
ncbi:hypothetical protein QTP70_031605 [Hemibagrus guttatus]|uniref:Ig-like domain-containing protein n=1 Tax=Hemibagrus guttatus TaxID=175788 RepID=A0AAE0RFA3_9TELE|nr:hypothetical protein QTP70_031605 [Hemibagrus guttatus]KAK3572398.1 hypothetical protein QTP86_032621 [Hemibagrus guttatus]